MTIRIGVDLGTTWTAAAVQDAGRLEALTLGTHTTAMPSVLAVDDGELIVGERAERQLAAEPSSGVRECKRRVGDTTPMVLAGTPYGAEALLAALLRHVTAVTAERAGPPDDVVVTHPATWGDYKLDLLREAGKLAGHPGVALLSEPEAAALHYAHVGRIGAGEAVAVYDFGGGTFDAAVVRCTEQGGTEILGTPEGLERLGGLDLDQVVVAHVDAVLDGRLRELDTTDPDVRRGIQRLRADCVAAKEALSADTEAAVPVALPGLSTQVRITREEFEAAIAPRVADTLSALDRTVSAAGLRYEELAGTLLVGGSSRIPMVAEQVSRHTGQPTLLDADPKLVVALGAAGAGRGAPSAAAPGGTGGVAAAGAGAAAAAGPRGRGRERATPKTAKAGRGDRGAVTAAAAGGVAAAGAAAAGVMGVRSLLDDGESGDDIDPDVLVEEESLDAFDEVVGGTGADGGAAAPVGSPGMPGVGGGPAMPGVATSGAATSGGGGPGGPVPRQEPPPPGSSADPVSEDPALAAVRQELLSRLEGFEAPEGADPAKVAALREDLRSLIDGYRPAPGQSVDHALASLQRQYDSMVTDFVQDMKIDALIEAMREGRTPPADEDEDVAPDAVEDVEDVAVEDVAQDGPDDLDGSEPAEPGGPGLLGAGRFDVLRGRFEQILARAGEEAAEVPPEGRPGKFWDIAKPELAEIVDELPPATPLPPWLHGCAGPLGTLREIMAAPGEPDPSDIQVTFNGCIVEMQTLLLEPTEPVPEPEPEPEPGPGGLIDAFDAEPVVVAEVSTSPGDDGDSADGDGTDHLGTAAVEAAVHAAAAAVTGDGHEPDAPEPAVPPEAPEAPEVPEFPGVLTAPPPTPDEDAELIPVDEDPLVVDEDLFSPLGDPPSDDLSEPAN